MTTTWYIYTNNFEETRRILTDGRVFEFTPMYLSSLNNDEQPVLDWDLMCANGIPDPRTNFYLKGSMKHSHILVWDVEVGEWRSLFKHKISSYGPVDITDEIEEFTKRLRHISWSPSSLIPDHRLRDCIVKLKNILRPVHHMLRYYSDIEEALQTHQQIMDNLSKDYILAMEENDKLRKELEGLKRLRASEEL